MPQATPKPAVPAPKAAPQAPVVAQAVDIPALQGQLVDLNIQAAALRAQQRILTRQLSGMRIDNPARAGVQQQSADVAVQLAQVEGKLATVQGRLAQAQGVSADRINQETGTLLPPPSPGPFRRNPDPDMVFGLSFVLAICIALPISIGYARRLWRGKPQPVAPRMDDIAPRLERLEQAVDSIAIEIERISEGQRFVTKILAERPVQTAPVAPKEVATPEGKPILALGAGPAEPIRINERQGVKQVITPH